MAKLEQLHAPAAPVGKPNVVFLHGLNGHPRTTWMCDEKDAATLWPVWVGEETGCPIWTLGYDAQLSGWVDGAMPLPDQATAVLHRLTTEPSLRNGPLVLIGHSLGGLVIKTAVVHAATFGNAEYLDLLNRLEGVVFIATPHMGSSLANLARALKSPLRMNEHVGDLVRHDAHLRSLHQQFRAVHQMYPFRVATFVERDGVVVGGRFFGFPKIRIKVVQPGDADPFVTGEPAVVLPADHFSICKPRDRSAEIHTSGVDFLRRVMEAPKRDRVVSAGTEIPSGGATEFSGRLHGPTDKRLQPREGRVYGREPDITNLLPLLTRSSDGEMVCVLVTGVGGIGKTELCKAALQRYLAANPSADAYWVEIPDAATAQQIPYRIGRALGADNVATFEELQSHLRDGLYYLDNAESALENDEGQELIRRLRELPGVSLLASSRPGFRTAFLKEQSIDALDPESAESLFRDLWNENDPLPERTEGNAVARFVADELGAHALTVTLMARMGDAYSYHRLMERWREVGSSIASDPADRTRMGSLDVSLRLTSEMLEKDEGALDLWTVAALAPEGLKEGAVTFVCGQAGWPDRIRQQLVRHHIWTREGDAYRMLPPLARYAIDHARSETHGFSWIRTRALAYSYFLMLAEPADSIASTDVALAARAALLDQFPAVSRFVSVEAGYPTPDQSELARLDLRLSNAYQFRVALSVEMLRLLSSVMEKAAHSTTLLADLESRLGNVKDAREQYDRALKLFEREQAGLGEANTRQSLGDLERRLGNMKEAREQYDRALTLYEREQAGLGEANTRQSLGDLESRLGNMKDAREQYDRALTLYEREQDGLGEANTRQSLGDLERTDGAYEWALESYSRALVIYTRESDSMGTAYTWAECVRCHHAMGNVAERDRALAAAFDAAGRSNIPDVVRYVAHVVAEIMGGREQAEEWIRKNAESSDDLLA